MALKPTLIQFLVNQIEGANRNTIAGAVSQLFAHLKNEIKDNPVYIEYEKNVQQWVNWPDEFVPEYSNDWELPNNFEDAKSLAYSIYNKIHQSGNAIGSMLYEITHETQIDFAVSKLNKIFLGYFSKSLEDILNANPEIESDKVEKVKGNKVFIIHGHDELLKKDLQLLLTKAGVNNLVLHEQADRGRTIIDKLIEEGSASNYAIAIMSPDDHLHDGQKRARQNVILEAGFFLGMLGKERVRLLVKGNIEIPSDLQGILYEKYDSSGAWKMRILKEIQAVGIFVDFQSAIDSF